MSKQKQPSGSQLSLAVGDKVEVTLDDGTIEIDTVRHRPTELGGHTWVAWLENRGSYLLTRCKKIDPAV